jgi:hypothetical protein
MRKFARMLCGRVRGVKRIIILGVIIMTMQSRLWRVGLGKRRSGLLLPLIRFARIVAIGAGLEVQYGSGGFNVHLLFEIVFSSASEKR